MVPAMTEHSPRPTSLYSLERGFRESFLDYDGLTAQVKAWAEAFPEVVRLESLGATDEGRELWLLTLGPDPDRVRPAVWVDGNMHAAELTGSSAALAIAEDVIRLHVAPDDECHGLPAHARELLRDVLVYVVPRMSPDGAEAVMTTGRYVRSVPRDARANEHAPRWISEDVDGDGLSLLMRVEDAGGEYVEAMEMPGLMVPRRIEDEGPYYKVFPEGVVSSWDGHTLPDTSFLSDNEPDLNRNFPYHWAPEPDQLGAGRFPMSELESRAIVEFTSARPNIFLWLNLHTFGGVLIRPLGGAPDNKMDPNDLALFRQLEAWATEHQSYPTVSGFEEFTYEPDKPLHGDLSDYAYHQRGCIAWVTELWDLFEQVGLERPKRFVERYTRMTRDDMLAVARWDIDKNDGRCQRPWKKIEHPQLGPVEVGGLDPRYGFWNPPPSELPAVCKGQAAVYLRMATMAPRLVISDVEVEGLGDGLSKISATVANHGYLPTYILSSAKNLAWNEAVWAEVEVEGCALLDADGAHREVGALEGWGRGLFDGTGAPYYQRSRGNGGSRRLSWTVRGAGTMRLRVSSCRTGAVQHVLTV